MTHPLEGLHWSARLSALFKQALALGPALLAALAWSQTKEAPETPWLIGWAVYAAIQLMLAWFLALRLDASDTRRRASWNDPGAAWLFVVVTAAACASLVAITLAVGTAQDSAGLARWAHMILALFSLAEAWLLIQTAFALHYARRYYQPSKGSGESPGGLSFPGNRHPEYLDFLYYAAVIGMTSQVSDVTVLSSAMRRLTLVHSILSFGFNLAVLAIAVNVFASALA